MMRTVRLLFIIAISIGLYGCHGDFSELGDGYIWIEKSVGLTTDEKTGTYEPIIHEEIIEYNNNLNFIIAHQKIREPYEDMIIVDAIKYSKGAEADSLRNLLKKMIRIKECYWIIDKKKHLVFGPMKKTDFLKKKKELGIEMELNSLH